MTDHVPSTDRSAPGGASASNAPGSWGSPPTREPRERHLLIALASVVVGLVASTVLVAIAIAAGGNLKEDLWVIAVGQVGLWFGLLGGPWWVSRNLGTGSLATDFGVRFRLPDAGWALLGPVLQVIIGLAYRPFVSSEELGRPARALADRAQGSVISYLLLAIATAVGAPLVEELFFRGLILRALRRSLRPIWAVLITAVLFALLHFEGVQTPALAFFGIVAGVLAVRTGRLGPSVWLHIGFNATAMAALAIEVF